MHFVISRAGLLHTFLINDTAAVVSWCGQTQNDGLQTMLSVRLKTNSQSLTNLFMIKDGSHRDAHRLKA